MRSRAVVCIAAALCLAGCTGADDPVVAQPTVPVSTTPRPDAAESEYLVREISLIYPDVPDRKIVDWSVSTCRAIRESGGAASRHAQMMFAGGTRPDPTVEQAEQIVAVISESGFCGPGRE